MFDPSKLPVADILSATQHGSPMLLKAVGRAFGLGDAERTALRAGDVPVWLWVLGGAAVGVVAGVKAYQTWPEKFPGWLKGS